MARRPFEMVLSAVVLSALFGANLAQAADRGVAHCPVPVGGDDALLAVDASDRLWFLRDSLERQARRETLWADVWGTGGLLLSAGNFGAAALTKNSADRFDSIVGGSTSLLIPAVLLVSPPRAIGAAAELHRKERREPSSVCSDLALAEQLFLRTRDDDVLTTGPLAHAIVIGFNLGVGLVLGLGYGHWRGAALNGLGGIAISEVQIWTRPRAAIDAYDGYVKGRLSLPERPLAWTISPWVVEKTTGAVLSVSF